MTSRELRLRARIDQLRDERDQARKLAMTLVSQRGRRHFGFCGYCGTPTMGKACDAHRDLLDLENELMARTTSAAAGSDSQVDQPAAAERTPYQ